MRTKANWRILVIACCAAASGAFAAGCGDDDSGSTDTGSDTGTESSTDTGSDTGTDTDSDSDSDTDSDSDSDSDTDTDTDSDSDTDTGTDTDSDSDSDTGTDTGTDTDSDSDSDGDTDTGSDTGTETDTGNAGDSCPTTPVSGVCTVVAPKTDPITADQHWVKTLKYVLSGGVFIGNGTDRTDITIDPGTKIYGDTSAATTSAFIIQQHSQVHALGTKDDPITFTSSLDAGSRNPGDWGGIVLNGLAPHNRCTGSPCTAEGEGDTGTYGGSNPHDNSGTLEYVRIEFAGKQLTPTKEFNGLSLQGVGDATVIHHIQVYNSADDPVEFFGGTVNVKYVICTGQEDDELDWTDGWTGKVQFYVSQQHAGPGANNGIEADNQDVNENAMPRSNPTLYNLTLVGNGDGADSNDGMLLRRGTRWHLHNLIVTHFKSSCLNIDTQSTWDQVDADNTELDHTILFCNTNFKDDVGNPAGHSETLYFALGTGNRTVDPQIADPYNETAPDFTLDTGSPALSGYVAPPDDGFFDDVDFVGGMGTVDWTAGWTDFPVN